MKKICCLTVDVVGPDKPPVSLAFLSSVCSQLNLDHLAISVNHELIQHAKPFDQDVAVSGRALYTEIFNTMRMDNVNAVIKLTTPVIDSIIDSINQYAPDCIMISVFSYLQFSLTTEILSRIKHTGITAQIIAGGAGLSTTDSSGVTNGKKLLSAGLLDYYVLGEGDQIIFDFLIGKRDMLGLNSSKHVMESWVPQIQDLQKHYVVPDYQHIDLSVYLDQPRHARPIGTVVTSRGCVRACTFCEVGASWPQYRYRSGVSVAREIWQTFTDTGIVDYHIADDLINGNLKNFRDFNLELLRLKSQHPDFSVCTYSGCFIIRDPRSHNEEFFKLIAAAGCNRLSIGVETGSDRLRFEMDKRFTNQDLAHHLSMSSRYHIENSLMLFIGYPTETQEDFDQTVNLLQEHQHYLLDNTIISLHYAGLFSLRPGTPVFKNMQRLGIIKNYYTAYTESDKLNWFCVQNPALTVRARIQRDLDFRLRAVTLRYPIQYPNRYLEYLTMVDPVFKKMHDVDLQISLDNTHE